MEVLSTMSSKGVFFDLYGTLLIYGDMSAAWSDWLTAFHACLCDHGLSISRESFASHCDQFLAHDEPPDNGSGMSALERRIQALGAELDIMLDPGETRQVANKIVPEWQKYISLDPDTIPVLTALKEEKTLGLISNFDHSPHIQVLITKLGLRDFFEVVVVSSDVGVKKPDPAIFHFALEQTNFSPDQVVYVGDSPEDVTGALAAGIRPIAIDRNPAGVNTIVHDFSADDESQGSAQKPDVFDGVTTISSLPQLLDIV
jgi:putative hydrolase of the HAD superfamily